VDAVVAVVVGVRVRLADAPVGGPARMPDAGRGGALSDGHRLAAGGGGSAVELRAQRAEVADRAILRARANPSASRMPFPRSGGASGKGKSWDEMNSMIQSLVLSTDVLPPHATTHGFLFYDMDHQFDAIRYSTVYIPDLFFMTDKKALLFFEIDLHPVSSN